MNPELKTQLKSIVPGQTYPTSVNITETDGTVVRFVHQSYIVGMYCAIYVNGQLATQGGDHDNKKHVARLKRDIVESDKRGATIEIGSVIPVKEG